MLKITSLVIDTMKEKGHNVTILELKKSRVKFSRVKTIKAESLIVTNSCCEEPSL